VGCPIGIICAQRAASLAKYLQVTARILRLSRFLHMVLFAHYREIVKCNQIDLCELLGSGNTPENGIISVIMWCADNVPPERVTRERNATAACNNQ
jgi:hypothetical protein